MSTAIKAMSRWRQAKAVMEWDNPSRAEQDHGFVLAAASLEHSGTAFLQAGCGVGKTGAMLWTDTFAGEGGRVIVAAFTKAQGHQNLRTAQTAVEKGLFKHASELRGRAEYVCLRRWSNHTFGTRYAPLRLPDGSNGFRSDVEAAWGPLEDSDWASVRSNPDDCTMKKCGGDDYCNRARERALEPGGIVCTNHAVVAFDVAYGGALLALGEDDVLLLDEGHQVADSFRSALGATITTRRFVNLEQSFLDATGGMTSIGKTVGLHAMEKFFASTETGERFDIVEDFGPQAEPCLSDAIVWVEDVIARMETMVELGDVDKEDAAGFLNPADRLLVDLRSARSAILRTNDPNADTVVWVEWDRDAGPRKLEVRPLDVSGFVAEVFAGPAAVMVMSATLEGQPMRDLGVPAGALIDAGSPFDLKTKRLGIVSNYSTKTDLDKALDDMVRIAKKVTGDGGGIVVISKTAKRRHPRTGMWVTQMEEVEEALTRAGIRVGVQGSTDDIPHLVDQLKSGHIDAIVGKRAVGEGIDIPGKRLSAVIFLDRPWPYMGDPVLKARARRSGSKWALPSALMEVNLHQGIGRLIRTTEDEGIVVMLDSSGASDFAAAMAPSRTVRLGQR